MRLGEVNLPIPAAYPILDLSDAGRVNLDWSISGGVLFGERETSTAATQVARAREITTVSHLLLVNNTGMPAVVSTTVEQVDQKRQKDVTVPLLDLSLGLAYTVDRFSIGAGYRWERYFDAIDGGFEEAKDADRTIDGPYLKISVGFGG